MTVSRAVLLCLLGLLATGLATPARAQVKMVESPLEIAPYPGVVTYALKHGIIVSGIEFAAENAAPQPGDEVVYLLTLQQASGRTQWLVRLTSRLPDPARGDATTLPADTMYTSTGLELHYTNTPAALDIEFIGPFAPATAPDAAIAVNRGHAVVSAESLELGMIRYSESALPIAGRLRAAGIDNPKYGGTGSRYKPDQIAAGRKAAAAFGLTPDEERLAFSVYFALRSFYQTCSEIPACREVLEQVVQKPSAWSVVRNLGVNMNFDYGWHRVQRLQIEDLPGAGPAYVLPLRLSANQQPALHATLVVGSTRPPLRTCAGIIALAAGHPTDASKRVFLRLLAARAAGR